jgi:hypothetical protein
MLVARTKRNHALKFILAHAPNLQGLYYKHTYIYPTWRLDFTQKKGSSLPAAKKIVRYIGGRKNEQVFLDGRDQHAV